MLEVVLIFLVFLLALTAPGFFTPTNFFNILRSSAMQGVIAFGMTMVIISGEIDLSVGSAVAFSGCLTAWGSRFLHQTLGLDMVSAITISIIVVLLLGFLIGTGTAMIRNHYEVPTLIITLALMTALRGFANLIIGGFPVTGYPQWFNFFGGGRVFGIPFPAIVFLITFAVINFVMTSTTFGRAIYAVGGNQESARLSGINVNKVKIIVLGATGALSALAGIMVSALIMSGSASVARGWELTIISSVIIGGTALSGGIGTVRGTFVGVLFLGVLVNGMTLLDISEYWQHVVRGALILGAVLINTIQVRKIVQTDAITIAEESAEESQENT